MANNRSIERHFTRGAAAYHQRANIQRTAATQLADQIARLQLAPRRVLDLGCGTGFLTKAMATQFPHAQVVGVDLSAGMVEVAAEQLKEHANVELKVADAMTYAADEPFDLVVSSSSLQWLRPYDQLWENVKRQLSEEGWLCATAMLDGTLGELHRLRSTLLPAKPPMQRLPVEGELLTSLESSGFEVTNHEVHEAMEHYESAREFFASIRAQGFTGGPLSQGQQALTRGELLSLIEGYQQQFGDEQNQVPASYCYGLMIAKRL